MPHPRPSSASHRFDALDALRGLAMIWMTVFHLGFDLNHFGYWKQDFYSDPFWTWQRSMIVSLFLFCAGIGQAMAVAQGQRWPRFWRRWAQVAGSALLVTLGSWLIYPQSFIYFGVLHAMALLLIIARLTAGWGAILWWLGALAIAFKFVMVAALETGAMPLLAEALNAPLLNWLGLVTRKPITEDYVPLLPWLGVMWWGVAAGAWLARRGAGYLAWPLPRAVKPLAAIGRWSLSYYMLHQPVLIGALLALGWFLQ